MAFSDMKWDDLRVFLHVARLSSLSAAAKALRLDPATLGRRIARLEEVLDARLFNKSPQGYDLTEAGQGLLENVNAMEQAAEGAEEGVRGSSNELSGSVRIGAPDGSANYLLPQICAEMSDENPGLDIQLVALPRVFNLSKREADMAITVSPPKTGRLTIQKIADYKLHLAATADYLAKNAKIDVKADLKTHRIIGYIPDLIFDDELDYMHELGEGIRPSLTSNSFSVQLNWIRQGAGVGIVHDFAIPVFPQIKKILTDELSLTRSFYLVRHGDDRKVDRLNRVAVMLTEKIRREVKRLEAKT